LNPNISPRVRGHAPVRLLLSSAFSRPNAERPAAFGEVMQLAGFWGDLLSR